MLDKTGSYFLLSELCTMGEDSMTIINKSLGKKDMLDVFATKVSIVSFLGLAHLSGFEWSSSHPGVFHLQVPSLRVPAHSGTSPSGYWLNSGMGMVHMHAYIMAPTFFSLLLSLIQS